MTREFPRDETGELLGLMQSQGDDLSVARDIDFFLIFDLEDQALAFASQADLAAGFRVEISRYEKTEKWQARLTVHMAPVYGELVMLEKQVAKLGRAHGGQADGWGCAAAS